MTALIQKVALKKRKQITTYGVAQILDDFKFQVTGTEIKGFQCMENVS
jgi:hypothetical protein